MCGCLQIDSLLSKRTDDEHEGSRRIKTEFLVQLDGAATTHDERLLIIGATNRPQEIDEAARRRLAKRIYIPLPDTVARKHMMQVPCTAQNVLACSSTEGSLTRAAFCFTSFFLYIFLCNRIFCEIT